jgi:hypothetical protein
MARHIPRGMAPNVTPYVRATRATVSSRRFTAPSEDAESDQRSVSVRSAKMRILRGSSPDRAQTEMRVCGWPATTSRLRIQIGEETSRAPPKDFTSLANDARRSCAVASNLDGAACAIARRRLRWRVSYSVLRALIGLMLAARRAGTSAARPATIARPIAHSASVQGSLGRTPKS